MTPITQNAISYIRISLAEQPNVSTEYEMAFFDRCQKKQLVAPVAVEWKCGIATIAIELPCISIGWYNALLTEKISGTETDVGAICITKK